MEIEDYNILMFNLKEAAFVVSEKNSQDISETIFPFWQEAIHEILKRRYCPCQNGDKENCFLSLGEKAQIALMEESDNFSFVSFILFLLEGFELCFS